MVNPRFLGYQVDTEREVFLVTLDSLGTPHGRPEVEGHHFVCLCVMDARTVPSDDLRGFCAHLLGLGCAYLCTWGPDCERVHDMMDRANMGDDPPQTYSGCVMTTWHAKDSLEDALEYFLTCTYPDENYAPNGCASALIISVGSDEWNAVIEKYVTAGTVPRKSP